MSNSILALALAAVLVFSAFGCGEQQSSPPSPAVPAAAQPEAEKAAETMEGSDMKAMDTKAEAETAAETMEGSDMKAMEDAKAEAEEATETMEGSEAK